MKQVLKYLKPHIGRMSIGFAIKFIGTLMDLGLPWVLAYMIDDVIPLNDIPLIFVWGGVMLVLSITAVITNVIANRMAARVARESVRDIRHDLYEKILYLSSAQVDKYSVPSLVSRMTTDTYNIHQMIGMVQRLGVRAPILLIGGIMVTFTLEPILTLVLIGILPFISIIVYLVSKKGVPLYGKLQITVDKMVRVVRENITGVRVIKALSKTEYEKRRFYDVNTEVVNKEKKAATTMAIINPSMNFLLNLGLSLVIVVGAYRVNLGTTAPGKIVAFLTYFTIILNAMLMITRMFVIFSKASASAHRISEVLDTEEDISVETKNEMKSEYHIEFDDVSFSYNGIEDNLKNINFKLKKGETLGIIGATGSGKTTIVNLLMRFYDIGKGSIRIEGVDIRGIDNTILRRKFGVVFQNDVIFSDSIYENIIFGRSLEKDQIISAVEYAQAKEFIDSLEHNYEEHLTARGSNLSGGQKQRVLISRALAANPEIVILDDSSSALDYKTDSLLRKAINNHFEQTTTIIIAQRISSIMSADQIIVLEDGEVLGVGTHDELIENCDIYKEISQLQMGGE
ncbi:MAG: transporter transrane region [Clostridiales bacterium]|jgi:ATP-binding cassette subfamily B protein|nr:transporter transrane region [Clostridiales bacterium]